jgi:hypothetical protein
MVVSREDEGEEEETQQEWRVMSQLSASSSGIRYARGGHANTHTALLLGADGAWRCSGTLAGMMMLVVPGGVHVTDP